MELLVRVRWRHAAPADLRFDIEPYHSIGDVVAAASEFGDVPWDPSQPVFLERTAVQLPLESLIVDSGLVSGDTMRFELYGVDHVADSPLAEAVSCDVTAGPEAGRSFVLVTGRHEVGRDATNTVVIDDPTVSGNHLSIVVYDDLSTRLLPYPEVVNPLTVNGTAVTEPALVGPNDVVQFGATAVALRVFSRSSDTERDQLGQVPFRRTPHKPVVVTERKIPALGKVPQKPEKKKLSALPAMMPMVMGLGMFAMTRQPYMLMMMAMSPAMLVVNHIENKKTSKVNYADQVEDLRVRLTKRRGEIDVALLAERAERISQSPDLADLARRAMLRTLDLWSRQAGDKEFLRLRLGIGTVRSKINVEAERGGEEYLLEAVERTLAGSDRLPAAPIGIDLAKLGVFGLHGAPGNVQSMCSSLILQAATLHSPEDLVIVVAEGYDQGMGTWVKWLPHTRSATSPIAGNHIADSEASAAALMRQLSSVARMRTATDDRTDRRWPWILVILDESANVDPALASQLLSLCPQAGISVIAAVDTDARVPRQAKATFKCVPAAGGALSSVWFTEPEAPGEEFEPEPANARLIDRVAMSLAPLRDATSASATTAIPRVVPLLSLFGSEPPTPLSINATWSQPKPYGLRAPIGVGPEGPLELDLVEHGPHALIGGTSGAGKSELLQSIVSSLIHEYPPTRLNFLFVDYKGGAATVVFGAAPHTVGYVTNLDASLSLRALTSLRAELNHRMRMLEGKAKDLPEMLDRFPDEAPPSLVIVVDEFATLVKEVPDFVAGVVDIAQRGRSLGVHLILATQRPSGSVNENILANTNLRISLRMLDATESKTVIGVGSAAEIPLPLKGRGFARLGPTDLTEFQSAFTGASLTKDADVSPVVVHSFGNIARPGGATTSLTGRRTTHRRSTTIATTMRMPGDIAGNPAATWQDPYLAASSTPPVLSTTSRELPRPTIEPLRAPMPVPEPTATTPVEAAFAPPTGTSYDGIPPAPITDVSTAAETQRTLSGDQAMPTHLDILLDAVAKAAPSWPTPRKPWREMLPEQLDWFGIQRPDYTTAHGHKGRYVTLGMLDDPAAQAQYPAVFDLEEAGGLLIGGSGGSGKTTALRTAALSVIADANPDEVTVFVLDCASRALVTMRDLPHVAAVATGDDLESITRIITVLSAEIDRRKLLLTDLAVQAENLTAYLEGGRAMPRIVVIVDGFQVLAPVLGNVRPMEVGPLDWFGEFQRIVTDGRQLGIHFVMSTDRRQGIPAAMLSAIGHRLVLRQTDESGYMDYGIPSALSRGLELPSGRALFNGQLVQIGMVSTEPSAAAQGAAISAYAKTQSGAAPTSLAAPTPVPEIEAPVLAEGANSFTLGRTDVFGDVVEVSIEHTGFCVAGPPRSGRTTMLRHAAKSLVAKGYEVWSVGLGDGIGGTGKHSGARADDALSLIEDFASLRESLPTELPAVLIVDNADRFEELSAFSSAYERAQKTENCRLIGSMEARNMSGYTQSSLVTGLRREPNVLMLQPDTASDVMQYTGVRPQLRPGFKMTPGRGVLVVHRQPMLVQVAAPDASTQS